MPHHWGKYSVQIESKSPTNSLVSPGGGKWGLTLIGWSVSHGRVRKIDPTDRGIIAPTFGSVTTALTINTTYIIS